jgi:peptidyl-prolyl cis-trans isomerase A (cyclophilin A)
VFRTIAVGIALLVASACSAAEEPQAPAAQGGKTVVTMKTSLGDVQIELDSERAPITVKNFLAYVDDGFYDGTVFHRVIPNFMVQGGGFDAEMKQKSTRPSIKNEAKNGLKNETGTLAMARTSDPNSASSQFFINLVDNDFLNNGARDFGYAVFARVIGGMDVVEKIAAVPTGNSGGHQNVPLDSVSIVSITRD